MVKHTKACFAPAQHTRRNQRGGGRSASFQKKPIAQDEVS
jgi:hypothetical protein